MTDIIKKYVKIILNKNQIEALESFINDRGESAFKNSNLLKAINKSDFEQVIIELAKWTNENGKYSKELAELRQNEIDLFTKHH